MAEVTIDEAINLAFRYFQHGQAAEAEALCRQILQVQPRHFHALHLLGICHAQRGEHGKAVDLIGAALQIQPNEAIALFNFGCALNDMKRYQEALIAFAQCLTFAPQMADAYFRRANILHGLHHFDAALNDYDQTLALRADFVDAHNNRGILLIRLERFTEALASFDRVVALQPAHVDAHNNRGIALTALKRFDEALASLNHAIALDNQYANAHLNRGNALKEMGDWDAALGCFDTALRLNPNFVEAHLNRAVLLHKKGAPSDAQMHLARALALAPDSPKCRYDVAVIQAEMGLTAEALENLKMAIAKEPDNPDFHFLAAHCRLSQGDYQAGWREFEWRWKIRLPTHNQPQKFRQPLWLGEADLAGKTVLLHAEQGLGDTLQFCRYAGKVAALGARVILQVDPALHVLISRLAGPSKVVARGEPLPDFDYHTPLMSLPLAFGTTVATIPANIPYLSADPVKVHAWKEKMATAAGRHRIGLVWAGNPRKQLATAHAVDRLRSIRFDQLSPLLDIKGIDYFSLQLGEEAQAQIKGDARLKDFTGAIRDFDDTAALIANLDLVICVDTSVAHLTGALGKQFWLLNRFNSCWRWLESRDDSPWYPSARLFRQKKIADWDAVIADVAEELGRFAA